MHWAPPLNYNQLIVYSAKLIAAKCKLAQARHPTTFVLLSHKVQVVVCAAVTRQ